jgi:L-fucose isomerase-like protein
MKKFALALICLTAAQSASATIGPRLARLATRAPQFVRTMATEAKTAVDKVAAPKSGQRVKDLFTGAFFGVTSTIATAWAYGKYEIVSNPF